MSQRHELIVRLRKLLPPPFVFRLLLVLEISRTFVGAKREIWRSVLSLSLSPSIFPSLSCIYLYQPSLFSVVAEDLTPETAKWQLPRAHSLHSRAHSLTSLSGHCARLLDNFLAQHHAIYPNERFQKRHQYPFGNIYATDHLNYKCIRWNLKYTCWRHFGPKLQQHLSRMML